MRRASLRLAMGNEVRWSFFLNDLALTMPSGVSLDTLAVTSPAPGAPTQATAPSSAGASTAADPTSGRRRPGLGTMNVSAKAFTYNSVANWLDSLAKLPTIADPYVGSISAGTEEGTKIVTFSSTGNVTAEALSKRYQARGGRAMSLSPRMWRVGGIAAAVLLLVGAWFAVISPTMQTAAALDVETASQEAASEQLRSRISLLKKQSEELACPGGDPGRDPAADATDRGAADPDPEPDDGGRERECDGGFGHPGPSRRRSRSRLWRWRRP